MSHVFYRFASQKDESRITFDGTHISVFDLKKEVMLANKMGSGNDFDLGAFDGVSGEEFKEDHFQIPRSTSLLIRRLPPSSKTKIGTASRYIAGTSAALGGRDDTVDRRVEASSRAELLASRTGRVGISTSMMGRGRDAGGVNQTKRFDVVGESDQAGPSNTKEAVISTGDAEEDARLAAMFEQQTEEWENAQGELSNATRVAFNHRGGRGGGGRGAAAGVGNATSRSSQLYALDPDKPPPATYICYRCGQKGHWIQACPQNDNPEWENMPRFKRTTGIPKSFLKTVEKPVVGGEGGAGGTDGVMITADGSFVMVEPDTKSWARHTKIKALTDADIRDSAPQDIALSCPICSKLVREAVRTPCCKTMYCEECIKDSLLEHDFVCPSCESKVGSLDKLKVDEDARGRVEEYVKERVQKSKDERGGDESESEGEGGKSVKDETETSAAKSPQNGHKAADTTTSDAVSHASKSDSGDIEDQTNPNMQGQQMTNGNSMNMNNMAAMNMMMNPMMQASMISMQFNQLQMALQNPNLPLVQRRTMNAQAQMLQQQMAQLQMMMGMGMGMGMNTNPNMNNMEGGMMPTMNQAFNNNGMGQGFNQVQQQQHPIQQQQQQAPMIRPPHQQQQQHGFAPNQAGRGRPPSFHGGFGFRGRGRGGVMPVAPRGGGGGGGGIKRPLEGSTNSGEAKSGTTEGMTSTKQRKLNTPTRPAVADNM